MRRESINTRRLCRLIDDSLAPYNTITEVSIIIPKQTETQLLIALSHVARQIKLWTTVDSDSDTVTPMNGTETPSDREEYAVCADEHHHCLTNIVTVLVSLLAVENRYVQHIAGSILVLISEFLAASVRNCYEKYIHLLGLCLELSTCNCLRTVEPPTRFDESKSDMLASFIALKRSLKSANWSTVAGVICVLRNILKHLKNECDDQLLKEYLNSVRTCLLNIPWDVFDGVGEMYLGCEDAVIHNNLQNLTSLMLFSGNLVQFFCSLAAHGYASETSAACMDRRPISCIISDVMPNILAWCLCKQDLNKTRTSKYLKHKILKLMIRLTYQMHLRCQVLVSWLNIIGKYFQDLLAEPLTRVDNNQNDSLEGSPFLDDILFKVLLQLFTIPSLVNPVCEESKTPHKVEDQDNMFHLILDLLNPICMFHLFLAELLYDYQVLLDYLISKDTGASSAEYLLRCLRAVCDSWTFFVEFSWDEEVTNYTNSKKRKVLVDVPDFEGGEISVQLETDNIPLSLPKRCMTEDGYTSMQHRTTRLPFEEAMECLLSLKRSLLNLHRKKLFPYNPNVLLRRLTKFEELCFKQKNIPTSESKNIV